jgi:dihydroflavonol-4-reductase
MQISSSDKILIMGGTGHLGSALIHHLVLQRNISPKQIRVFYLPNSPTHSLDDVSDLDLFPGNILNAADVQRAITGMTIVFHMIGNTTFDPRSKGIQWKINVEGTRNVINSTLSNNTIKRMVYTSTVNTLGIPSPFGSIGNFENSDPYTNKPKVHSFNSPEECLKFADAVQQGTIKNFQKQINVGYFDSKLTAQELINRAVRENGLNVVSILPGTMFGPYDYLIGNGMYLIQIYHNGMPGVLPGGLPLAHVMDVVEGHILAFEKAKAGSRYIITGFEEDNLYLRDMVKIVASVIREKNPERDIKIPNKIIPKRIAIFGAHIMELYSKLFNKSNPLSITSVRCGCLPSFYTYRTAEQEIGYTPKRRFRQAVEEMYDYYLEKGRFSEKERYLDKVSPKK